MWQMMNTTDVKTGLNNLAVTSGEAVQTTLVVSNSGNAISQFSFSLEGLPAEWYSLAVCSTTLFPHDNFDLKILFHPPLNSNTRPGIYQCSLLIRSRENSVDSKDIAFAIEVKEVQAVEIEISPDKITGKNGSFDINVRNPGLNQASVQLQLFSASKILIGKLSSAQLSVPPCGTARAVLNIKLRWLHYISRRKQYEFTVAARHDESGRVNTVHGQLQKAPAKINLLERLKPRWRVFRRRKLPKISVFESNTEGNRKFSLAWAAENASAVSLEGIRVNKQGELPVNLVTTTNFTLTAVNKHGTDIKVVTIEPLRIPGEKYSNRILVSMQPKALQVEAGGAPVEALLEVMNASNIVDEFSLELVGLPESWYNFLVPSVALMPHTREQVRVKFHPPRTPGVRSGSYSFAIVLRSQSLIGDYASVTAQLDILPALEYAITVKPFRILFRRTCTFQVKITNKDVSNAVLFLDIADADNGLYFKFKKDNLIVPPWQNIEFPVVVRTRRNSLIGDIKRYEITVTASTDAGQTQSARCQVDHKPLLSSWRLITRTLRYVLLVGVVAGLLYYFIRLGGGWSSLVRDPQTWLEGTIRHIKGWFY